MKKNYSDKFDLRPIEDTKEWIGEDMEHEKSLYIGKHVSFHNTWLDKDVWAFNLLPFIEVCQWRILIGWLCFSFQYTY